MRCYHLTNFYLSSIQKGIQSAHAQMELFNKYAPIQNIENLYSEDLYSLLTNWSLNYKTMIVLNGGMELSMQDSLSFLSNDNNPYPFAPFYESDEALNGVLTNIAIILPEKIYQMAEWERRGWVNNKIPTSRMPMELISEYQEKIIEYGSYTTYENELTQFLINFGLAS